MVEEVKKLIKKRGLTVQKFAIAYDLPYSRLKQTMSGIRQPTEKELTAFNLFML